MSSFSRPFPYCTSPKAEFKRLPVCAPEMFCSAYWIASAGADFCIGWWTTSGPQKASIGRGPLRRHERDHTDRSDLYCRSFCCSTDVALTTNHLELYCTVMALLRGCEVQARWLECCSDHTHRINVIIKLASDESTGLGLMTRISKLECGAAMGKGVLQKDIHNND